MIFFTSFKSEHQLQGVKERDVRSSFLDSPITAGTHLDGERTRVLVPLVLKEDTFLVHTYSSAISSSKKTHSQYTRVLVPSSIQRRHIPSTHVF